MNETLKIVIPVVVTLSIQGLYFLSVRYPHELARNSSKHRYLNESEDSRLKLLTGIIAATGKANEVIESTLMNFLSIVRNYENITLKEIEQIKQQVSRLEEPIAVLYAYPVQLSGEVFYVTNAYVEFLTELRTYCKDFIEAFTADDTTATALGSQQILMKLRDFELWQQKVTQCLTTLNAATAPVAHVRLQEADEALLAVNELKARAAIILGVLSLLVALALYIAGHKLAVALHSTPRTGTVVPLVVAILGGLLGAFLLHGLLSRVNATAEDPMNRP